MLRLASSCLAVSLFAWTTRLQLDGFSWIFTFERFSKICRENSIFFIWQTLHEDLCMFVIISRWVLLRIRNVSDERCREKSKHISYSKNIFLKSCLLWDNVEQYDNQTGHSWPYNTGYALYILDKWDYKNTQTVKYLLLFDGKSGYTKRSNVTSIVHCLSFFIYMYISSTYGLRIKYISTFTHILRERERKRKKRHYVFFWHIFQYVY